MNYEPIDTDSNIIRHADRELHILGYVRNGDPDDPNTWMYDNLMAMVRVFVEGGHSGASASYALSVLPKLLNFENVTPITDDPDEWEDVSLFQGRRVWQCRRNGSLFSEDGGKTYYSVDEFRRGWKRKVWGHKGKIYKSEPKR